MLGDQGSGPAQGVSRKAVEAGRLDANAAVTVDALVAAGVLSRARDGVKVLGQGDFSTKLTFEVWAASASAVEAIEKAGGSVKILRPVAEASA